MKCMKSLNIAIFLLFATFTSKVFAEESAACMQSQRDLKRLQERQDEIKHGEGENQETRRNIETSRDKLMAQLLLHQGVEATLAEFDKTLKDIKLENNEEVNLLDLIESTENAPEALSSYADKIAAHRNAISNTQLVYNLFRTMGLNDETQSTRNQILRPAAFTAFLSSMYQFKFNAAPGSNGSSTWTSEQVANLKTIPIQEMFDHLINSCQSTGIELSFCVNLNQALSGDDENQIGHREDIIKGYLGAMTRNIGDALENQNGEATDQDKNVHQAFINQMQSRLPSGYFKDNGDFDNEATNERVLKLAEIEQGLERMAAPQNIRAVQTAQNNYLTCRLKAESVETCRSNHLNVDGVDVAAINQNAEQIQDYVQNHIADSEELSHEVAGLYSLVNTSAAFRENSLINQLLAQSGTTEALNAFDPAGKLTDVFKSDDHNCVLNLVDRFTEGGEENAKKHLSDELKRILSDDGIGIKCNFDDDFDLNSEDAAKKQKTREQLITCLRKLKSGTSKEALAHHKQRLKDQIEEHDARLAEIDSTNIFKDIERLKKIEFNRYVTSCLDNDESKLDRCQSTDTSPIDGNFDFFKVKVGDVVSYINISADPGRQAINPGGQLNIDEQLDIHNLCNQQVNGEFIRDGISMCQRANQRITRYNDNNNRVRQLKSYDRSYTTRTAPDGSKIYTKKLGLGYRLGYAALGTTQSWLRFGSRYMQNEARLPYLKSQALYFTQMKAWSDQYSSRFQLGNLHSPATFSFSQQPELFRG